MSIPSVPSLAWLPNGLACHDSSPSGPKVGSVGLESPVDKSVMLLTVERVLTPSRGRRVEGNVREGRQGTVVEPHTCSVGTKPQSLRTYD